MVDKKREEQRTQLRKRYIEEKRENERVNRRQGQNGRKETDM